MPVGRSPSLASGHSVKWCRRDNNMSMASAGNQRGWRIGRERSQIALEVVLLDRMYVLPWAQFLYAEGGDDEVRLVFATHDVLARGAGLQALLADLAAQRLVGIDAPARPDRFGGASGRGVCELFVQKVDS
jgi:hypothetical protein